MYIFCMSKCKICGKSLNFFQGFVESNGNEYCRKCYPKRNDKKAKGKIQEHSSNQYSKEEIKKYKELVKGGFVEYLLTQGGKMGILFAGIIFLFDYFAIFGGNVQGAGNYLFLGIFFGLAMGLFGWYSMNKKIEEHKKK